MIKVENLSMLFSTEEVQTKALNDNQQVIGSSPIIGFLWTFSSVG